MALIERMADPNETAIWDSINKQLQNYKDRMDTPSKPVHEADSLMQQCIVCKEWTNGLVKGATHPDGLANAAKAPMCKTCFYKRMKDLDFEKIPK